MQFDNRIIDDLARVASSALGVASGVRDEVEARMRQQFERLLDGLDLVSRDEFEAVKAMAAEARAENERLAARLAALEQAGVSLEMREESEKWAEGKADGLSGAWDTTRRRTTIQGTSPCGPPARPWGWFSTSTPGPRRCRTTSVRTFSVRPPRAKSRRRKCLGPSAST